MCSASVRSSSRRYSSDAPGFFAAEHRVHALFKGCRMSDGPPLELYDVVVIGGGPAGATAA